MQQLEVASIEHEGTMLQVVFVPPETSYFDDRQITRLRDILVQALQTHNMTGELVAVWQDEGEMQFLGNPRWFEFLESIDYEHLFGKRNAHISVT